MSRWPEMIELLAEYCQPDQPQRNRFANYERGSEAHRKRAAQCSMSYAIRCGVLSREDCSSCGMAKDSKGKSGQHLVMGHHEDYDKPLEVIWLCVRCHHRVHAAARRARKLR